MAEQDLPLSFSLCGCFTQKTALTSPPFCFRWGTDGADEVGQEKRKPRQVQTCLKTSAHVSRPSCKGIKPSSNQLSWFFLS